MRFFLIASLVLVNFCSSAQEGYKIDLTIKELKDTSAYLGYYLQGGTYIKDTAKVDHKGSFSFTGKERLPQGSYMIVLNKTKLFEFVAGERQHFSLSTSSEDYIKNMVVDGDEDNRLFFDNWLFQTMRYKEAEPLLKIIRDSTLKEEQKQKARKDLAAISSKVRMYQQDVIQKNPKTITARIMNMNIPVTIPDPPVKPDGSVDSSFQLRYARKHFFDHLDLSDPALLRMSQVIYWDKVKEYLDRLFVQQPDSLSKAIGDLAATAKKNPDTYKYLLWNCIRYYQTHEIMGLDVVYINLFDKYFATGEMDYWLDKKTIQNMKEYADKLRHAMIGSRAPNLIMQNENRQPRSIDDIRHKYTIVYFFKPSCGHCRQETPKLVNFYNSNKNKFDLEVFAVSTDTAMQEMKDFINEMKTPWITVNGPRSYIKIHFSELYYAELTPTVYITDDKKKIIARRIGVEQIGGFLENYEKMLKKKENQKF